MSGMEGIPVVHAGEDVNTAVPALSREGRRDGRAQPQ
jgi:hypothetical protein